MTKRYNFIIAFLLTIIFGSLFFNVLKYPELFSSKLKYQLYNDIKRNNPDAISYYINNYISKGKILYDDFNITDTTQFVNNK